MFPRSLRNFVVILYKIERPGGFSGCLAVGGHHGFASSRRVEIIRIVALGRRSVAGGAFDCGAGFGESGGRFGDDGRGLGVRAIVASDQGIRRRRFDAQYDFGRPSTRSAM
jgi:hypothetical protein